MRYLAVLTTAALSAAALLGTPQGAGKVPQVEWQDDLDAARAVARRTGKPLFVVLRCER